MRFTFTVEVEVERSEGKFASRDEIGGQLTQAIESASPGTAEGDEGGVYEVTSWEVEEELPDSAFRRARAEARRELRELEAKQAAIQQIIDQGGVKTVWLVWDRDAAHRNRRGRITESVEQWDGIYIPPVIGVHLTEEDARKQAVECQQAENLPEPEVVIAWELEMPSCDGDSAEPSS